MKNKAIIINGSPRENGNTKTVAEIFFNFLREQSYEIEMIDLVKLKFSSCIGCEKCRKDKICTGLKDDFTPIYETLISAELWVLGSPVHHYNVSAWMKAFLDRLYCFYDFQNSHPRAYSSRIASLNKKAFIYGIAEQLTEYDFGFTIEAMQQSLKALGIKTLGAYKFFGYFSKVLKKDQIRIDLLLKNIQTDFLKTN